MVSSFGFKRLSAVPSTAGAMTRLACAKVTEAGIELTPLLARAGLTSQQISDDKARIPVRSQIRLVELAADVCMMIFLDFTSLATSIFDGWGCSITSWRHRRSWVIPCTEWGE
jgi:hypothetical protein